MPKTRIYRRSNLTPHKPSGNLPRAGESTHSSNQENEQFGGYKISVVERSTTAKQISNNNDTIHSAGHTSGKKTGAKKKRRRVKKNSVNVSTERKESAKLQLPKKALNPNPDENKSRLAMPISSTKIPGQVVPKLPTNKRIVLKFVDYLFSAGEVVDIREELVRSNSFIMEDSITSCMVVLSRIIIGLCSSVIMEKIFVSGLQIYKVHFPPSSICLVEEEDTKARVPAIRGKKTCDVRKVRMGLTTPLGEERHEVDVQNQTDSQADGDSPLPCPQYLPLKRVCRCEEESSKDTKGANSSRQVLPNVNTPELAGIKVLWTQATSQVENSNMFGNVMHYLDWEEVMHRFGPNIYFIDKIRTQMDEIRTQVLVTRRTYTSLQKLDLHTHGSPLLLGQDERMLQAVSYHQATNIVSHFTQIALENLYGDEHWFHDDGIKHSPSLLSPNWLNGGHQDEEVTLPKCKKASADASILPSELQTKKLPESQDNGFLNSFKNFSIDLSDESKPQPKHDTPPVNQSLLVTAPVEGSTEMEDRDEESIYSDAMSNDSFQIYRDAKEELDFNKRIVIKFVDYLFSSGGVADLREELVRSNPFIMEDSITSCIMVLSRIIVGFNSISVRNEVLTKGLEIFDVHFPPSSMRLIDEGDPDDMGPAILRPDSWGVWNDTEGSPRFYSVTEIDDDAGELDVLGLTDIDARLLPCPQYLPLEKLSRCVHLEEAVEIIRKKYLPSFELKIESKRELVDTKVFWCQGMWSFRRHNMFGNVSFYRDWEEVFQRFGPNIYILRTALTQKEEIRTQVLVTNKTYPSLQKLDLHKHGSALLLGRDGRMLRAVSYQKTSHIATHITQIALEDLDDDGRWFYAGTDIMCNDHMTKEHHICFKHTILKKNKKPCPYPLKAEEATMLLESMLSPEEMEHVLESQHSQPMVTI